METSEIIYLEKTINELTKAYKKLSSNIIDQDHNFKELQKYMVEYKNELDKFQVYDYQQTLSMIDKHGFARVMEREQVRKLIESPYFGRFDFYIMVTILVRQRRFILGASVLPMKKAHKLSMIGAPLFVICTMNLKSVRPIILRWISSLTENLLRNVRLK